MQVKPRDDIHRSKMALSTQNNSPYIEPASQAAAVNYSCNGRKTCGITERGRMARISAKGTRLNPNLRTALFRSLIVCFLVVLISFTAHAQATAGVSGTVTGPSGKAVASARVAIKNLATGQSTNIKTNSAGAYDESSLAPGDYQLTASAPGFDSESANVTLAAGAAETKNFSLTAALTLAQLGISPQQAAGSPQEQARLNKRSHMLQIHQRLGLITTIPLIATVVTGAFSGGKPAVTSSTTRDLHAALGATTAGLYFATAYYAIFAPKIPGTKAEGPIRFHKAMAWIHGPGMILTPILGAMAFSQRANGERVHGIAKLHGQVAIITAAAYGLAILSVTLHSGPGSHAAHAFLNFFHRKHRISVNAAFNGVPAQAGGQ